VALCLSHEDRDKAAANQLTDEGIDTPKQEILKSLPANSFLILKNGEGE